MFRRILIANRGEIAVRIAQTLQEMGITAIAVHSDMDRAAPHVACADEAYAVEGRTAGETYLRGDRLIAIAKRHKADAIHPGYGFLSENADFAQACHDAGIIFIGPRPDVIRAMGDKLIAKRMLAEAGVPVVPGYEAQPGDDIAKLKEEAGRIGYPVLIKAAAGGGGKGMRIVDKKADLQQAMEAAQREANAAFGDGRVFLEKCIQRPRHVEFQIFGDEHGRVVHLFERECSVQRRYQKIVEETPSPALTPDLRARMGEAAVRAAKAAGYTNAGTVEFMVDDADNFYFLEINARLQVEHPVTEMTLGHDLVRAQLLVAAGEPLPFSQESLVAAGHALECRIYAEDADRGFLPSTGVIDRYIPPHGVNIRVDSGVTEGSEVTVYYDPMLAKLVVWGRTRDEAIDRMAWALKRFVILGVTTNIEFLHRLITHPAFRAGRLHTGFLDEHRIAAPVDDAPPDEVLVAAALAARDGRSAARHHDGRSSDRPDANVNPWQAGHAWRVC